MWRRFGGTCRLPLQSGKIPQATNNDSSNWQTDCNTRKRYMRDEEGGCGGVWRVIFCDITLCITLNVNRRFGRMCCFRHQGSSIRTRNLCVEHSSQIHATWYHVTEDKSLHYYRCGNLKSNVVIDLTDVCLCSSLLRKAIVTQRQKSFMQRIMDSHVPHELTLLWLYYILSTCVYIVYEWLWTTSIWSKLEIR
jgi:hypothetical protein